MRRSTFAYLLAASSIVLDGAVVAGWYAARELDDRPRARRRARVLLTTGVAVAAAAQGVADLAWQRPVPATAEPDPGADPHDEHSDVELWSAEDITVLRRYGLVALVATAVVWPLERRAPAALQRRGVRRPHLIFGVLSGSGYALATAPVWLAHARARIAAQR
ncbi:hypothetical protein LWF15_30560 [Kineosporia rhizophila]|uniref:hypothetical protein n=1 Tax=Kineosporia rhizophila TaxID=84633 RepID=UPI001E3C727E|nr:hypothetical protein [Kineosporia rhizophila]MCE0539847.1 hypothetical protein [Kineosporia rhizophila]